jgi:prepilin-type N-terminal cleavage/methylation domain-containing protein
MSRCRKHKLILSYRSQLNPQGFSLTEVVVSILVLGLFTVTATTLMTYAAQGRVGARSNSIVTDRLQQMLEEVRDRAATLPETTTACSATVVTNGYGQLLSSTVPTAATTVTLNGRVYTVARTLTAVDAAPFDRLRVTYTLTPEGSTSVANTITMETEVIPNAAFNCP